MKTSYLKKISLTSIIMSLAQNCDDAERMFIVNKDGCKVTDRYIITVKNA